MLEHLTYMGKFLSDHKAGLFTNDSVAKVELSLITPCFRCIGVHHLTPNENQRRRNIYLDCIDAATGKRLTNERIEWGWDGMRAWEKPSPVILDKPPYEPAGNISVDWGQIIWVRVLGQASDMVSGLTTQLPDQGGGNTLGHHSYYIVFAFVEMPVDLPPVEPPPVGDCEELRRENVELKSIISAARDLLGKV